MGGGLGSRRRWLHQSLGTVRVVDARPGIAHRRWSLLEWLLMRGTRLLGPFTQVSLVRLLRMAERRCGLFLFGPRRSHVWSAVDAQMPWSAASQGRLNVSLRREDDVGP